MELQIKIKVSFQFGSNTGDISEDTVPYQIKKEDNIPKYDTGNAAANQMASNI
jgi:hypothetical protein